MGIPSPTDTGTILALFGRSVSWSGKSFDLRRQAGTALALHVWIPKALAVLDPEIELALDDALARGVIRNSYANVLHSRIGGQFIQDYVLFPLTGFRPPTVPDGFSRTRLAGLRAIVHHNAATIADSTRLLLLRDGEDESPLYLSEIVADENFAHRSFDALWCTCHC